MQITCPACGKTNSTGPGSACTRCGCDLAILHTLTHAAAGYLVVAAECLRASDWANALRHADLSWTLRHSALAAQLACLAASALGDATRLINWRRRSRQMSPGDQEGRADKPMA